jgi:hypothetical protein
MIKVTVLLLLLVINEKVLSFSPTSRSNAFRYSEFDSYSLFETNRIISSSLYMNLKDDQNQYKNSNNQITFLLTKAVELINKMTSKKTKEAKQGNGTLISEVVKKNSKKIPISLSFSSTHKHEISLKVYIYIYIYIYKYVYIYTYICIYIYIYVYIGLSFCFVLSCSTG